MKKKRSEIYFRCDIGPQLPHFSVSTISIWKDISFSFFFFLQYIPQQKLF